MRFFQIVMVGVCIQGKYVYDCENPCTYTSSRKTEFIFNTYDIATQYLIVSSERNDIYFSKKYNPSEVTVMINHIHYDLSFENVFDPLMQITKYKLQLNNSVHTISVTAKNSTIKWSVHTGTDEMYDALQLIAIPIDMVKLHGVYWSGRFYDWIFFVVNACIATVYVSSFHYYKQTLFDTLIVYAIASLSASFTAKLYHTIVSVLEINYTVDTTYAIFVIGVCFEIVPIALLFVYYQFYMSSPYISSSCAIVLATLLLFCGSGMYFAPTFILFASVVVMMRRSLYLCAI